MKKTKKRNSLNRHERRDKFKWTVTFIALLLAFVAIASLFSMFYSHGFTDREKSKTEKEYTQEEIEGSDGWSVRDDLTYETLVSLNGAMDWPRSVVTFEDSEGSEYYFYFLNESATDKFVLEIRKDDPFMRILGFCVTSQDEIDYWNGTKTSAKALTVKSLTYGEDSFSAEQFLMIFEK